ncbi:hypothetical protein BS78_06G088400 [Paspalum vaginatum]|nr:hypothetical protein BS78_06G088400 [Paspalum vaginatum]
MSAAAASPSRASSPTYYAAAAWPLRASSSAIGSNSSTSSFLSSLPPGSPGLGSGDAWTQSPSSSSCAACRHQRRKCPPDCVLKPYFPSYENDKFRNALQMFGVSNMQRILMEVPKTRWDACMRTIVYESNVRWIDPVRGCIGTIQHLEDQLMDTAIELELLTRRLESYRWQAAHDGLHPPNPNGGGGPPLAVQQQAAGGGPLYPNGGSGGPLLAVPQQVASGGLPLAVQLQLDKTSDDMLT